MDSSTLVGSSTSLVSPPVPAHSCYLRDVLEPKGVVRHLSKRNRTRVQSFFEACGIQDEEDFLLLTNQSIVDTVSMVHHGLKGIVATVVRDLCVNLLHPNFASDVDEGTSASLPPIVSCVDVVWGGAKAECGLEARPTGSIPSVAASWGTPGPTRTACGSSLVPRRPCNASSPGLGDYSDVVEGTYTILFKNLDLTDKLFEVLGDGSALPGPPEESFLCKDGNLRGPRLHANPERYIAAEWGVVIALVNEKMRGDGVEDCFWAFTNKRAIPIQKGCAAVVLVDGSQRKK